MIATKQDLREYLAQDKRQLGITRPVFPPKRSVTITPTGSCFGIKTDPASPVDR